MNKRTFDSIAQKQKGTLKIIICIKKRQTKAYPLYCVVFFALFMNDHKYISVLFPSDILSEFLLSYTF